MINNEGFPSIFGRKDDLFLEDFDNKKSKFATKIENSSILIIGGAGSIGSAITKLLIKFMPFKVDVLDINENGLVELVRDIRSSTLLYDKTKLKTFVVDVSSQIFESFLDERGPYDFVFNLSALKHVRSEKDHYTLMRMIEVNIISTFRTLELLSKFNNVKYFSVSTDKASYPVNLMGASKRIMEGILFDNQLNISVTSARFANVAFSQGSLLEGFINRINKNQPLSSPNNISRFFISSQEAARLSIIAAFDDEFKKIYVPGNSKKLEPKNFSDIAIKFLNIMGYTEKSFQNEDLARKSTINQNSNFKNEWPCYFFKSETSGEKLVEEFFSNNDIVNFDKFKEIGLLDFQPLSSNFSSLDFVEKLKNLSKKGKWDRDEIIKIFHQVLPEFNHLDTGKFLDEKM